MIRRLIPILAFLAAVLAAHLDAIAQPYLPTFPDPLRTFTVSDTADLNSKLSQAQPGDRIYMGESGTFSGLFVATKDGTAANPIVIEGIGHAKVTGGFQINGDYNYVIGLEITGGSYAGVDLFCSYCGPINNVIHGQIGKVGIGMWNSGPGQIAYGNIVFTQVSTGQNPHNIYTQNDFAAYGYKWLVMNVVADPAATGNTFNMHAYAQGNRVSGYRLKNNIWINGDWLVGSASTVEPDHDNISEGEFFYKSFVRFGYTRPTQSQLIGGYFGRSDLQLNYFWGEGEALYGNPPANLCGDGNDPCPYLLDDPSKVEGNTFVMFPSSASTPTIRTARYISPGTIESGKTKVLPSAVWDLNFYHGFLKLDLHCNNTTKWGINNLAEWRQFTQQYCGKTFDANSTHTAALPANKLTYLQNEYDDSLGFLVVYNWESKPSISFSKAGSIEVHRIKDPYGTPVVSGSNSVVVPLASEFETFLVRSEEGDPEPECDVETAYQFAVNIMTIRMDATKTFQKRVRLMGKEDAKLIDCLELIMGNQ